MKWDKTSWSKLKIYSWHLECMQRDNYKCVVCGSDNGLLVHHIDNSRKRGELNNNLDNLVTLCRQCHAKEHNQNSPKNQDIIELIESGLSYGEVGKKYDISRQRVHQIYIKYSGKDSNC